MDIKYVEIKNLRLESLSGQTGNAKRKEWNCPVKLHAIAEINDKISNKFNEQFQLYCTIYKNNKITDDVEFIHGNKGCKNPCRMRQISGNSDSEIVFTFEINKPGDYIVGIGNRKEFPEKYVKFRVE